MFLGSRLRELRTGKGLTQQKLGDLINVTKTSICYFEKNERCPNIDTLSDLCDIFEVSADYFLGRDIAAVADNEIP